MIYSLKGKVIEQHNNFFVLECGGIGFKVNTNRQTLARLPAEISMKAGSPALNAPLTIFCFLYVREDKLDLYGFLDEQTLKFFEMLNDVSGIGPKTALNVLDLDTVERVMAAIVEKRTELIARASGIGRKTAERVILELHSKIVLPKTGTLVEAMDINREVEEALVGLGYQRSVVRNVLENVGPEYKTIEERLKRALKALGARH